MPLNLGIDTRFLIALKAKYVKSFETLPKWVKEVVFFGERNGTKENYSVDLPDELIKLIPKK